jgi:hypothetical protein
VSLIGFREPGRSLALRLSRATVQLLVRSVCLELRLSCLTNSQSQPSLALTRQPPLFSPLSRSPAGGEMVAAGAWAPYAQPARRTQHLASPDVAPLVGATPPSAAGEERVRVRPGACGQCLRPVGRLCLGPELGWFSGKVMACGVKNMWCVRGVVRGLGKGNKGE